MTRFALFFLCLLSTPVMVAMEYADTDAMELDESTKKRRRDDDDEIPQMMMKYLKQNEY